MIRLQKQLTAPAIVLLLTTPLVSKAEPPVIQTKGTVIYLAENLNEEAKLGWCIDTQGRGFSDKLHAHSCKPSGGDTQFSFNALSGMIQSVEFDGKCMTLNNPDDSEVPFGLFDCVDGDATQQFIYDSNSMEFRIATDESKCVAVDDPILEAGPFQSRHLIFAQCADLTAAYKQWVIRE